MATEFRTGMGAPWLDLLTTRAQRYSDAPVELLTDPGVTEQWLGQYDLAPTTAVSGDDVGVLRELREALHRSAIATIRASAITPRDMRTITAALAADRPLRVRRAPTSLLVARPLSAGEAFARLARDAAEDLVGPQRSLLRPCGDSECSGIFLNHTGRRRWCSDERCGVRARVRSHRARVRAATLS